MTFQPRFQPPGAAPAGALSNGVNPRAILALAGGVLAAVAGSIVPGLKFLFDGAWFSATLASFFTYYALTARHDGRRAAHPRPFGARMKIYDLSQPLNEQAPFWPYYPPFEVKYIKRKAEHGVNAQYIQTSNHMGTHLDAPRHFVTKGMTIDQIPMEWLCGPGCIVDLTDEMDELAVYTPEMIESRVEVKKGDILILHTGWHRYAQWGDEADEEKYIHMHPGAHPDMVPWLLEKQIHIWGVDVVSTDHPMDLPIGRFLGKGMHGHCDRVRAKAEAKFGGPEAVAKLFPDEDYQLTHNKLFDKNCMHIENLGGQISDPAIQNRRLIIGCFPWKFQGGEAAFARVVAFDGEWPKEV